MELRMFDTFWMSERRPSVTGRRWAPGPDVTYIIHSVLITPSGERQQQQMDEAAWYTGDDYNPENMTIFTMLVWCWASVDDGGPTLNQDCENVSCFLGTT